MSGWFRAAPVAFLLLWSAGFTDLPPAAWAGMAVATVGVALATRRGPAPVKA